MSINKSKPQASRLQARTSPQGAGEEVEKQNLNQEVEDDLSDFEEDAQPESPALPDELVEEDEEAARLISQPLPSVPRPKRKVAAAPKGRIRKDRYEPDSPDSFSDSDDESTHFGESDEDMDMDQDLSWDITDEPNLPYVPPRPGFKQRWVRFQDGHGKADTKRISKMIYRKHWRPRRPDTLPSTHMLPSKKFGQMGAVIMVEGLVLCELPEFWAKRYKDVQRAKTHRMIVAEKENLLNEGASGRVPISHDSKSQVVKGRVPRFA